MWVYRNGTLHRLGLKSVLLFSVCSPKGLWQMIKFRRKFRKRRKDIATEDYRPLLDVDNGESIADLIRREVGDEFLEDFCEKLFTGVVLCPPEGMGAVMGLRTVWNAEHAPAEPGASAAIRRPQVPFRRAGTARPAACRSP